MDQFIKSVHHPFVKHLIKLRDNRRYRYNHRKVIVEGSKMLKETCSGNKGIILIEEGVTIPQGVVGETVVNVSSSVMKKISGLKSSEGIIAEVDMPENSVFHGKELIIAADGINDPGNLGTLIRTALALGWDGLFVLDSSVDPYNDKALRAAKGATFRLPLALGSWKDLELLIKKECLSCWFADTFGELPGGVPMNGVVLVLGNESRGPSEEAQSMGRRISIPMVGNMESLNVAVAGGILMYTLKNRW